MDNNGHDTNITYTSAWLQSFLPPLLNHPSMTQTLFLITYDEDDFWVPFAPEEPRPKNPYLAPRLGPRFRPSIKFPNYNRVYALLLGSGIQPGSVDNTPYNHYSILASLQHYWGLSSLGQHDVGATPFSLGA